MADFPHVSLDEIVVHFQQLQDPRSTVNQRHPMASVAVIAVLAVLAGAAGPTAIARWAALKEELLVEVLDLPNGVPRKDVSRRVLMVLKPAAFQACFAGWLRPRGHSTVARHLGMPKDRLESVPRNGKFTANGAFALAVDEDAAADLIRILEIFCALLSAISSVPQYT